MSPEQRQLEINRIRKKMGLTEKQVESMAKRDADNELRWEAGLQYMKEREAVVQQYSGQEQEEKLSALREQYLMMRQRPSNSRKRVISTGSKGRTYTGETSTEPDPLFCAGSP